jgi:hypothetical protein
MTIDPELVARIASSERHLVIGGSLDGQWIPDAVTDASVENLNGAVAKVGEGNREAWRVVRFRLGRVIDRHVWILRGMTEAEAFDRLLASYCKRDAILEDCIADIELYGEGAAEKIRRRKGKS